MDVSLTGVQLPIRLIPVTPLGEEQLFEFCAANDTLDIERDATGELIVMTPAGNRTGRRNSAITRALDQWAEEDGRGYAFDSSTGFSLPDGSMRSPDAAWIDATRWNALDPNDQDRFSHICPDFVIELRSQSDKLPDMHRKMQQWLDNGVQLAWIIDPYEREVTIFRPHLPPERHHNPTSIQGTPPISGFELILARLWS